MYLYLYMIFKLSDTYIIYVYLYIHLSLSPYMYIVLWLATQSCPTLCDPMDCSLSGSSGHVTLQARLLEWVAISSSSGIVPTQGLNPGLPHSRHILYCLSHHLGYTYHIYLYKLATGRVGGGFTWELQSTGRATSCSGRVWFWSWRLSADGTSPTQSTGQSPWRRVTSLRGQPHLQDTFSAALWLVLGWITGNLHWKLTIRQPITRMNRSLIRLERVVVVLES